MNSAIYALTPLSSAVTFLFAGRLATLIPPRRLSWIGMSLLVVGLAVTFLFPNQFTFLIFYAMLALGVGYGIMLAAALAIVSQIFPKRLGTIGGALTSIAIIVIRMIHRPHQLSKDSSVSPFSARNHSKSV